MQCGRSNHVIMLSNHINLYFMSLILCYETIIITINVIRRWQLWKADKIRRRSSRGRLGGLYFPAESSTLKRLSLFSKFSMKMQPLEGSFDLITFDNFKHFSQTSINLCTLKEFSIISRIHLCQLKSDI